MNKFLEAYKLSKLNQEESEYLNKQMRLSEIEAVIKKLPTSKSPGANGFTGELYQTFREELIPPLLKLFQKIQEEGKLPSSFYEASIILVPNQIKTLQKRRL